MKEHIKRKRNIISVALPPKGTKAYQEKIAQLEKASNENQNIGKEIYKRFKKAVAILEAQNQNGAALPMDSEIRFFLNQFNYRAFRHGLRSMPMSYNVMEGFFDYRPELNYFQLLNEENYLFSLFDYVDFITSPNFNEDIKLVKENVVENLIYHFDILNAVDEITFTTEDGAEHVIGGVSLLRRGDEMIVFLLTGLITDTEEETSKLSDKDFKLAPGKEDLEISKDFKLEAVRLFENRKYWKTFAYCRIDLNNLTIGERYIQKDIGHSYTTTTDDPAGFSDGYGKIKSEYKKLYEDSIKEIVAYSPIFELATKCIYLPYYFNLFEDKIVEEEHPTALQQKQRRKSILAKQETVPDEFNIKSRTVFSLNRNVEIRSDIVFFGENGFKIERSGFWKKLEHNVLGKDKNGSPIHGKSWVDKTLTWYESDKQTLTAQFNTEIKPGKISGKEGFVYIMRNASHDINLFKIGLTTLNSKDRARKLSGTTASPDKFLLAHEWFVTDCVSAEKLVHSKLEAYRINNSREFFRIDFELAMDAISKIVKLINDGVDDFRN
ncbi:MAG: GIY-YIG nuclease family protein [Puia sp.]